MSTSEYIPAAYPYTVIANRAGSKAWVSLWNDSAVAELDLGKGKVTRRIELWHTVDPVAPGTHPTTMLLNRSEVPNDKLIDGVTLPDYVRRYDVRLKGGSGHFSDGQSEPLHRRTWRQC